MKEDELEILNALDELDADEAVFVDRTAADYKRRHKELKESKK